MDEIRFHPEALEEYEAEYAWYEGRSLQSALRFEAELDRILGSIRANPGLFLAFDGNHRFAMLRRFPFSVVYRRFPDEILVVALAHSRRSAGYWRGRT